MNANSALCIVFAEQDNSFFLMEPAIKRELTSGGEKALRYLFGPDFSGPLAHLTAMADRLGLPPGLEVVACADEAALAAALPTADFLVTEQQRITREHISKGAGRLRLIQKFGRDCRNIDVAAARELGVPVANLVRLPSISCAEHAMALMLALARNLLAAHSAVLAVRNDNLEPRFEVGPARAKFNWASVRGLRILANQTLGLIGLGENSGEIAKRASAFGMRVCYYKRNPLREEEERALGGAQYLPLKELLAQADFISIHVPYGPPTEKMVGAEFLAAMKPTAYLINTSRGGIVDEEALYHALKDRRIAGAALDVYRYEPVPPACPLLQLDNILWTPHMSGGEPEFILIECEDVLSNIARVCRGETPLGLLTGNS